jgi:O-antigen ligase
MKIIVSNINLFILTSFPIFALIIRGWVSSILFLCLSISLFYLVKNQSFKYSIFQEEFSKKNNLLLLIVLAFVLPIISIFLTSLGKFRFNWGDFDGPSRYLFAIIFLFFLLRYKLNIGRFLIFSISLMPITTFLLINVVEKKGWASALPRTTIYFIDPITFGSLCLSFGLLGLTLLSEKQRNNWVYIWFGLSMLSGFYLSISSESRTGWLAVPIIFFLLLKVRLGISYLKTLIISTILISITSVVLYQSSEIVKNRFNQVTQEISSYQWNEGNNSTSIGERISYIRMGWHLILQKPLTGWANLDFTPQLESPEFSKFATPSTRLGVKGGGFHNEFINNGVKYGIPGIFFTILLFLGPAIFFLKVLKMHSTNRYAVLGIVYITAQAISSLSYQVLDFKFTASLYALMIVTLAYSALNDYKFNIASHTNNNC